MRPPKSPKISIAVPSLNYGKFISACLESIELQNYENYEVLIADGGSRDDSVEIIGRFCARDSRFTLVSAEDTGQVDAIIKAFSHATGDIFCFLNADDYYLCSDAFSAVVDAFSNYPNVDFVSFAGYYVSETGKHMRPVRLRYHPRDDIGIMKYRSGALQPATFWSKKAALRNPLRRDFEYSFDTVFFYESFQLFSWIELAKPIAAYRWHGGNKSAVISGARTLELARFERMKFGRWSTRFAYLCVVAMMIYLAERLPIFGTPLKKTIKIIVNAIAYVSVYRLPGI